jgi:hypothetical protein
MAVSPNPRSTFPYVLGCDVKEPRSKQTRWQFRNLSRSDFDDYARLAPDSQKPEADEAEIRRRLFAELSRIVAEARGPDGAFENPSAEDLAACVTAGEAWELYYAGLRTLELTEEDRKNSRSPQPSEPAGSAAAGA